MCVWKCRKIQRTRKKYMRLFVPARGKPFLSQGVGKLVFRTSARGLNGSFSALGGKSGFFVPSTLFQPCSNSCFSPCDKKSYWHLRLKAPFTLVRKHLHFFYFSTRFAPSCWKHSVWCLHPRDEKRKFSPTVSNYYFVLFILLFVITWPNAPNLSFGCVLGRVSLRGCTVQTRIFTYQEYPNNIIINTVSKYFACWLSKFVALSFMIFSPQIWNALRHKWPKSVCQKLIRNNKVTSINK